MTIRRLTCACCGGDAGRWEQHWNRDTGYGVCAMCVDWMLGRGHAMEGQDDHDSIVWLYGREGVNWGRVRESRMANGQ